MNRQRIDGLKVQILPFVASAAWRREDMIARRFGAKLDSVGRYLEDPDVSDALFALVREGKLEWFGAEDDVGAPMKYRVPRVS